MEEASAKSSKFSKYFICGAWDRDELNDKEEKGRKVLSLPLFQPSLRVTHPPQIPGSFSQ